ncbi:MAG: isoprenylcysteine carboxylmethyltransferase family protein [Rhizobiaceae bacterium]|nr:isoprenylcysteine carboxylmethyltransferase family protein [Rhizobiaceae bacterium]MCV0408644.1 isoprenylcysteine carboxylmethyltransferase family protein [Rhizobiaceae bacterium]
MTDYQARPNIIPWPPIIYLAAVLAGLALHVWVPLPWFGPPMADILFMIGILVAAAVVLLYVQAIRAMKRANTTIHPHKGSDHLVTEGPFKLSRNPLYLGNSAFMVALGLIAGGPWLIIMAVIASIATTKLAIVREEKHLEARFGKAFRDYRKTVRRWI